MKQIDKYTEVEFLGLYEGQMTLWYTDKLVVGDKEFLTMDGDDYGIWSYSQLLNGKRNSVEMLFNGNEFVEWPKGRYGLVDRINGYFCSINIEDKLCSLSVFQGENEYLLSIETDNAMEIGSLFQDKAKDVIMLSDPIFDCHKLLFYSKIGKRLWEYKEEDEKLEINGRCIPIVDDVVVVISMKGLNPKKIQGFDIKSGKRIWETNMDNGVANTIFVGPDNMLYGCKTTWIEPFVSSKLILTKLNPLTGKLQQTTICEGECFDVMPWLVTMHGNKLYYTDNRRGNEIGVIDVEKKELVERMPLNINKKVTIGAPVVTDDKVYVFIKDLQELRVFEK